MKLFKELQQFVFIFVLWVVAGYVNAFVGYAAVLGVFIWLIGANKIRLLVLVFLLLLVFSDSRHEFLQYAVTIKPVVAVLLGIVSYLMISKKWAENSIIKFYLPFFGFIAITLLLDFGVDNLLKSLSMFLIIFNVPVLVDYALRKDKESFLKLFFYGLGVMLLIGLVLRVVLPELTSLNGRYTGILGNPNGLGIFITVYYFLFQVTLYYFPKLFKANIKVGLYFLIFASLLLCQSRNAMLNIGVFHAFMFLNKRSVVLSFIVLGVIITSYGAILTFAVRIIESLGLQEFARLETLKDGSGRTIAWDFIWIKIKEENFWMGTGIGSTERLFKENYVLLSGMGHQGNAHNSFLTLWFDLGIFGMISFFLGYIGNMLKTIKNYIAFPIVVGLLLSANFESWLAASLNPFHIGAIMIIVLLHFVSREKINEQREIEIKAEKLIRTQEKLKSRKIR